MKKVQFGETFEVEGDATRGLVQLVGNFGELAKRAAAAHPGIEFDLASLRFYYIPADIKHADDAAHGRAVLGWKISEIVR